MLAKCLICMIGLTCLVNADISCPLTKAKFNKLISDKMSDSLIDQGCQLLFSGIQKGSTFTQVSEDLSAAMMDKLMSLTAFYGPALNLYMGLSDWQQVANISLNEIKRVVKPYYVNRLMKKKPATVAEMDAKIKKWLIKKVVRGAMIQLKKVNSASDWNTILSALWSPIRFDANGFTKPSSASSSSGLGGLGDLGGLGGLFG